MRQLKFEDNLLHYPFVLSFDLAKHIVGWTLMKVDEKPYEIVTYGLIDLSKCNLENFWLIYKHAIKEAFDRALVYTDCVVVTKEKLPSQAGGASTIATLQALAKAHAVFEVALYEAITEEGKNLIPYDDCAPTGTEKKASESGVHAASVKALFRKITGLEKPTKQDIRDAVCKMCVGRDISDQREDISDSAAVTITLREVKFNNDIEEEKKALRKRIRSLKLESAKEPYKDDIEFLDSLKLPQSSYEKV